MLVFLGNKSDTFFNLNESIHDLEHISLSGVFSEKMSVF